MTSSAHLSAGPRGNHDTEFLAAKVSRLNEPHVAPLNNFAREIRAEMGREVPAFDPDSGGVHARALLLHEAPGARSTGQEGPRASAQGSGVISPDNNDQTAENMWHLLRQAPLDRNRLVFWNVVPWYVGTGTAIRAVGQRDLGEAAPYLARLIQLLPELRVVVTLGIKPRDGWFRFLLSEEAPVLPTLVVPHPSPQSLNPNPENRALILAGLRKVAALTRA